MEKQVQDIGRRLSALEEKFTEYRKTVRGLQTEVQELKTSLEKALCCLMPKIDSLLSDRTNTDNVSTVADPPISIVAPSAANLIANEQNKHPPTSSTTKKSATSVFQAAEIGDIETLLSHLVSRISANKRNEKGYTLLQIAVSADQEKTAKALLDAGASVNAKGLLYTTPLHLAAEKGFLNIVQMLLDAGADSNAQDTENVTPLMLVAKGGFSTDVVKLLIDKGASLNACDRQQKSALWYAVNSGAHDIVKLLCDKGASVNSGICLLKIASERGNAEAVMLMLQCKNPPNTIKIMDALSVAKDAGVVLAFEEVKPGILKNNVAELAMIMAAYDGRVHSLKALLDAGVYVNARDGRKYTALWYAKECGKSECIKLLLERGAKE